MRRKTLAQGSAYRERLECRRLTIRGLSRLITLRCASGSTKETGLQRIHEENDKIAIVRPPTTPPRG